MFESLSVIGAVNIITSDEGGLSNDQIADMLASKLIYIY